MNVSEGEEERKVLATESGFTFYWIQGDRNDSWHFKLTRFTRLLLAALLKKQSFLHLSMILLVRSIGFLVVIAVM